MDVVERLHQVVHRHVPDPETAILLEVGSSPGICKVRWWNILNACCIELMGQIGVVGGILGARDQELKLLNLGDGTIVGGIRYRDHTLGMVITLHLEGASATALIKMISPHGTILVDHALLDDIAIREGQGRQEI